MRSTNTDFVKTAGTSDPQVSSMRSQCINLWIATMQSGESRGSGASTQRSDVLSETTLPRWVVRSLADNGITRCGEAAGMTDDALLMLRGVGIQSVKLIRTALGYPTYIPLSPSDIPACAGEPSTIEDGGTVGH
ncbi:hypothetical protein [Rhizobium sp. IMFF44]|uniref:hypothetical protein n=1 Tax=unclassified Rhizobium TaxID=2613769 RepID=UPI0035BAF9C3